MGEILLVILLTAVMMIILVWIIHDGMNGQN